MTVSGDIMGRAVSSEPVTLEMSDGRELSFPAGCIRGSWETKGMLFIVQKGMMRIYRKADIAGVR